MTPFCVSITMSAVFGRFSSVVMMIGFGFHESWSFDVAVRRRARCGSALAARASPLDFGNLKSEKRGRFRKLY